MNARASRAGLLATVATLVLLGFAGGFFARPLVQKWTEQLKGAMAQAARQRYLQASFVGKPVSDLAAPTLDGRPLRLGEKKGKVVLLFFWASWCPYSRAALPAIQAVHERYADRGDFEVIGVSLDRNRGELDRFVASQDIRWINLYEDGQAWKSEYAKAYEVRAIPSRWIIGKDSTVIAAELDQGAAEDTLSLLLENRRRVRTSAQEAAFVSGGCAALESP